MILHQHQIFERFQDLFASAAGKTGIARRFFVLNERVVELRFAGEDLDRLFSPALGLTEVAPEENVSLRIHVFDGRSFGADEPSVPEALGIGEYRGRNFISKDRKIAVYGTSEGTVSLIDLTIGEAYFWFTAPEELPYWESGAPFRIILNRWAGRNRMLLLHAAAIGWEGRGLLLVGQSGSGKSSTALTCFRAGFDYCGDDHVLLDVSRMDRVHSIFSSAKIHDDVLDRVGDLSGTGRRHPRKLGEKNMWFIENHRIRKQLDISALLVPRFAGGGKTEMRPLTPVRGLLALAPSTLAYCLGDADDTMRDLGDLVKKVPVYELSTGTDPEELVQTLRRFLGSL